ncbi:MAG: pyridoxamine 5'-phosphate oxidase family protein, partial [Chloroflexi bacterium]|nr:pyridoxamine 5'-phosphate oxidase family protein [Chloroflexota bacterium]
VKTGYYAVRAVVERGHVTPALSSAGGLALLAALGTDEAAALGLDPRPAAAAPATLAGNEAQAFAGSGRAPMAWDLLERTRKAGWVLVEDALELGQVSLAAPVLDFDGRAAAAIELLGPAYRIVGDGLAQAAEMVVGAARQASLALGCADYRPYASAGTDLHSSAGLQGVELDAFLAEPWLASLACLRENGYPYTVPVWYEWRDGAFWVVPRAGSRWAEYVRLHPQVSMTISETAPPFRRVLVEGPAELAPGAYAAAIERRMAHRYLGPHAESYLRRQAGRADVAIRIVPDKLTSWTGLVAHPRYSAPARSVAAVR